MTIFELDLFFFQSPLIHNWPILSAYWSFALWSPPAPLPVDPTGITSPARPSVTYLCIHNVIWLPSATSA